MIKPLDSKTYAIRLYIGNADWIYLTDDTGSCTNLVVSTYETINEAKKVADQWKRQSKDLDVKVVEYEN